MLIASIHLRRRAVGAAVLIVDPVEHLAVERTAVETVGDAIAVGIDVGAAVVLFGTRLIRAAIARVGHPILVRVWLGLGRAAVVALRARGHGTAVEPVDQAVPVGIVVGAASVLLRARDVLAVIALVGYPVAIGVLYGAPLLFGEAGIAGTGVLGVGNPVVVEIAHPRRRRQIGRLVA